MRMSVLSTSRRRILAAVVVSAGLTFATIVVARASVWTDTPSYHGCTTVAYADAYDQGSYDDSASFNDDTFGCATLVANKMQAYYDGYWHDSGWDLKADTAVGYASDDDISQSRANNQIETGTGDWSGFFYSSFLVPN